MKDIGNKKRVASITLIYLLLGLIVSAVVFVSTSKYELNPYGNKNLAPSLCTGVEEYTKTIDVLLSAGLPAHSTIYVGFIDVLNPCFAEVDDPVPSLMQSFRFFISTIGLWEFLINWLFWSAIVFVFLLIPTKIYRKYR